MSQCRLGKCIIKAAVGDGEKGGIRATPWVGFGSVELFVNWYTYHAHVLFGDHACLTNSMLTTPLPILYVAIAPPVSSLSGLGIIPPASVLTSVARISEPMLTTTSLPPIMTPEEGSLTPARLQTTMPAPTPALGKILSPALEPVPYWLVQRIRTRQFVEMRDLLSDNIALHRQWEAAQGCVNVATMPMSLRPRFREVPSLMSWVYCFLTYVSVRMVDEPIEIARDMLSYCRLIIREAFRHGGEGWREYDRTFQSRVAIDPTIPWHSIRPELQATTLLGQHGASGTLCSLCQGTDHQISQCALQSWHHLPMASRLPAQSAPRQSPQRRPETLSRICSSWNSGACRYPGTCNFRHICATCQLGPHRARDCIHTPEDSTYKRPIPRQNRPPPPARTGGRQGQ